MQNQLFLRYFSFIKDYNNLVTRIKFRSIIFNPYLLNTIKFKADFSWHHSTLPNIQELRTNEKPLRVFINYLIRFCSIFPYVTGLLFRYLCNQILRTLSYVTRLLFRKYVVTSSVVNIKERNCIPTKVPFQHKSTNTFFLKPFDGFIMFV